MHHPGILRSSGRGHFAKIIGSLHPGCHQAPDRTWLNRYPEIFAAAAVAAPESQRILSFGCSTGEECITLAEYFSAAQIIGADINPVSLLKAMKHRSDRIRFIYASDRLLSKHAGFDVLFCMSVLRSSPRKRDAGYYPFKRFEERALFLETLVRPGGLLVIHESTYRFSDTAHRYSYERIPVDTYQEATFLPDGVTETKADGCLFRKLGPRRE